MFHSQLVNNLLNCRTNCHNLLEQLVTCLFRQQPCSKLSTSRCQQGGNKLGAHLDYKLLKQHFGSSLLQVCYKLFLHVYYTLSDKVTFIWPSSSDFNIDPAIDRYTYSPTRGLQRCEVNVNNGGNITY